jgi:homoserine O-acetyltransferase
VQSRPFRSKAGADEWYDQIVTDEYTRIDTNDSLYQYEASSDYNPAPDLEKINARVCLIVFDDDQINSPEFAVLDREMPRVKNGRYVIIRTGKEGHGEARDNTNAKLWQSYLQDLLQPPRH